MAYIVNYNPYFHDLYKYISGPTIDPENYSNNTQVYGYSYNNNLWIKIPGYSLSNNVDFSGIDVRPRGAPSYGFDTWTGASPSGISFVNGVLKYPNAVAERGFLSGYEGNIQTCYYPGCPDKDFTRSSNYNYWNNGAFAKILISPKHFISTLHFAGYGPKNATVYFLGKGGTFYTKTATKKFDFQTTGSFAGYTWPTGYTWPSSKDWCLFELGTAFTESELNDVKIYKFANLASIPPTLPIYLLSPQSVVTVRKRGNEAIDEYAKSANYLPFYFDPNKVIEVPFYGYESFSGDTATINYVWDGDSGTPSLVYDENTNDTYFLSLLNGGGGIFDNSINPSLYPNEPDYTDGKILFDSLQKYIYDQIGYTIGIVNVSSAQPPPPPEPPGPYPSNLFVNGKTLTVQYRTSPNETNVQFSLEAGLTYSFAIIAYNSLGYSGYSSIENFYLPYSS